MTKQNDTPEEPESCKMPTPIEAMTFPLGDGGTITYHNPVIILNAHDDGTPFVVIEGGIDKDGNTFTIKSSND